MDPSKYQELLGQIDDLDPVQLSHLRRHLDSLDDLGSIAGQLEATASHDRRCPKCGTEHALKHGKRYGLQRYRCRNESCRATFNAVSATPLKGLRKKEVWQTYCDCMALGLSLEDTRQRCGISLSTAFRWRHRFLAMRQPTGKRLTGLCEVDETYFLTSRKGDLTLREDREPRRRGGHYPADYWAVHGFPVLSAVARGSETHHVRLEETTTSQITEALADLIDQNALLVTDGHRAYRRVARNLGIPHESVVSRWRRVQGTFHVQGVNAQHEMLKTFLNHNLRGVSTYHLPHYLEWFYLIRNRKLRTGGRMFSAFLSNETNSTFNN